MLTTEELALVKRSLAILEAQEPEAPPVDWSEHFTEAEQVTYCVALEKLIAKSMH